ncbi:hypothetical protein RAA17_07200 [Komagataeibacter rhaeticus]|nr:hypothetical protein [Komagataeibacter rhaeticus]
MLAYAIPHMFHSVATAAKVNKGWRYSFWSEVYETVMALFLVRVTIVTMMFPSKGKFNVTEKVAFWRTRNSTLVPHIRTSSLRSSWRLA